MGINVAVRLPDETLRVESDEKVKQFMAQHGWAFANGRDADQKIVRDYNVARTPTTLLITRSGEILARRVGAFDEDGLVKALQRLVDFKEP